MDEYSSNYRTYVNSGRSVEVINGKAYSVSNVYVTSSPSVSVPPYNAFGLNNNNNNKVSTRSRTSRSWFNDPEIKRRKRIAQYKWYSVEGKVKVSFKSGFRWFRHTCRKIVRGF